MSKRLSIFVFVMLVICNDGLVAQLDIAHFTKYNTVDGLNQNHVLSLTQDAIGFMWIGTESGPMRYDGTSFVSLTTLNPDYAQSEPLTFNLSTLDQNEIGISTNYGAYILNTNNYQFRLLQYNVEDELTSWAYSTFDVGKDRFGNYGVSTKTGFYVYNAQDQLVDAHHVYSTADIGTSWMLYGRDILRTPDGQMLQKSTSGINVFNAHTKKIEVNPNVFYLDTALMSHDVEIRFTLLDSNTLLYYAPLHQNIYLNDLHSGKVYTYPIPHEIQYNLNWFSRLVVRNDSTLLINGKIGLYEIKMDRKSNSMIINPVLKLPELEITAIYSDHDGRLWIGTYSGLYKEDMALPVEQIQVTLPGQSSPLQIKWLEKGDGVWYASTLHDGLLLLDRKTFQIKKQVVFRMKEDNLRLSKMLWYDADNLWICSNDGILEYNIRTGEHEIKVFKNCPDCTQHVMMHELYRDSRGDIWMSGSESNAAYRLDHVTGDLEMIENSPENPKFKINIVYRFSEDGEGNIWFCGDAIARYNSKEHKVDSLIEKLPLQVNPRKVFLMFHTSADDLWFSSSAENWHIYNAHTGWSLLDDPRLMPNLNLYQSLIDDVLYYVSRQGKIIVLNTTNRQFRILSARDGWDQETMRSLGFFKDTASGYVMFAGDNVIYRFKSLSSDAKTIRPPFISEINVLGKRIVHYPDSNLVFASDEHTLQIKLVTLNYTDPSNELYAYRLKGNANTNWISIDQPEIILTQIPSGHYTLEVSVTSKNNGWPAVYASYPMTIRFPFYLQWWFLLLAAFTFGLIVWWIVHYRLKQLRFISNLDRMVIEYELKALHAQMNPHFVFNCLNSIKEMIMSKDNANANLYLNKFSFLLRSTLDQSKMSFVSLRSTIDYLGHYLEMEKLRFSYFRYSIEVQPGMEEEMIRMAPLLLQPIVENAIWHGQSNEEHRTHLNIRFYVCDEDIVCEVEDFGVGMEASKNASTPGVHLSSALDNIRKRIELLNSKYDVNYRLSIIDKSALHTGQGTTVRLMFKNKNYAFDENHPG